MRRFWLKTQDNLQFFNSRHGPTATNQHTMDKLSQGTISREFHVLVAHSVIALWLYATAMVKSFGGVDRKPWADDRRCGRPAAALAALPQM
jgi:hypothetical protein